MQGSLGSVILLIVLAGTASAQRQPAKDCVVTYAGDSTTEEVIRAACIPVPRDSGIPLDQRITSYEALNDDQDFILAYYDLNADGSLHPPLHLLRYNKGTRAWLRSEISKTTTRVDSTPMDDICFGSVLSVQRYGRLFYVGTHVSPSAGCELVLSQDMTLKHTFYGWVLLPLSSGRVIFENSMIHFAPTHPTRLSMYDPAGDAEIPLYPPKRDRLRAAYMQRLRTEIPPEDKCRGENCAFDPAVFESDLISSPENHSGMVVNEQTKALAFIVQFSAYGFIDRDKTDGEEFSERVLYVFRGLPDHITYRQYPVSQMKDRFHADRLEDLLTPAMLRRIFADPPRQ